MRMVLSLALAVLALLLPPRGTAAALVGTDAPTVAAVTSGVLILKALLFFHALVLALAPRLRLRAAGGGPLLAWAPAEDARDLSPAQARIGLAVILLVGSALRLHDLGEGLWYDEILTLVWYARLPLGYIVSTFDSQNQHMLYSVLAHGSLAALGDSAWALRLPAALFGIASLWATYWFGTKIATRRESLLAAALLTASYHHVWFSQNARGYSGLLFWTLVTSALFLELVRARDAADSRPSWGLAVAYAVASALAVFTHTSAVFVTVAHFLVWCWLLARARTRGAAAWMPLAGFVLAATLTLQLYALALPQMLATVTRPTMAGVAVAWKSPAWFIAESLRGLSEGVPGGLVAVAGAAAIGLAGLASYWRRSPAVVAIMIVPALLTAVAMFAAEHNLWPRFFFFCAGFAVLIAVRGVFAVVERVAPARAPLLATAALALLVAGSAVTLPRAYRPKQDYLSARDFIERERASGDAVVTVDLTRFPYERYLATGWLTAGSADELEAIERRHGRTWVVYTFPARLSATEPALWSRLQHSYRTAATFPGTVGGGAVIVMVRG